MATGGSVAPELRKAEVEIDRAHLGNELLNRPFGEAAWHYLAACEARFVVPMIAGSMSLLLDNQAMAALADSVITQAKWPLLWMWNTCREGGSIPTSMIKRCSTQHLLCQIYLIAIWIFEAAYTYASIGVIGLTLDHNTVVPDPLLKQNAPLRSLRSACRWRD